MTMPESKSIISLSPAVRVVLVLVVSMMCMTKAFALAGGIPDDLFKVNLDGPVNAVVVQQDGTVVMGGNFDNIGGDTRNNLARVNTDGSISTSSNVLGGGGEVLGLALQPDNKVLVGGDFTLVQGQVRSSIARLNANGSLDLGFNPGAAGGVGAFAIQSDGKILVGGLFSSIAGQPRNNIARLNPNGTIDPDFNASTNGGVRAIAVQADGKIVIAGEFGAVNGKVRPYLMRLQENGSLDNKFITEVDSDIYSMAMQTDGKILIGGDFSQVDGVARNRLARINPDGSIDADFEAESGGDVLSILVQDDGGIVIGGVFTDIYHPGPGNTPRNRIARLTSFGTIDNGFDPDSNNPVYALAQQQDRKLVVGGAFDNMGGKLRLFLARIYPSGHLDDTLDTDANLPVRDLAIQSDGKILVAGNITSINDGGGGVTMEKVARLNPDGELDLTFMDPLVKNHVSAVAVQDDRKIVIGGDFELIGVTIRNHIARLNPNGALDLGYNPNANNWVSSLATQSDGKVIIAGYFDKVSGVDRNLLARINTDGSLDGDYDPDITGSNVKAVMQQDEKVLVFGTFTGIDTTPVDMIARLNQDGSLDTSFTFPDGANIGSIRTAAIQPDGKIVLGGTFTQLAGQSLDRIARLNANGSLDMDFDPGADGTVQALSIQADGKILVGGYFAQIGSESRDLIARLLPNGSVDLDFNPGVSGGGEYVATLISQEDGKVLFGGHFTTVGTKPRDNLARVTPGDHAEQSLDVSDTGQDVTWVRSGSGPALKTVRFVVQFLDDFSLKDLGFADRNGNIWTITKAGLPRNRPFAVQAQGRYGTSLSNRGSSLTIGRLFNLPLDPTFCFTIIASNGNIATPCL